MVVAVQGRIRTPDHVYSVRREAIILSRLTDDGLLMVDPETLDYVPLAAKSYKYLDDTTLDFEIRPGVRFHHGGTLTADDVIYSYRWVLNRRSRARTGGRIRSWLSGIEKTGPMSIRLKLKFPYPLALRDIATAVQLRKRGTYHPSPGMTDRTAQARTMNGTGPYRIVAFEPGKKVVLERFENYYRDSPKGRPAIGRIVLRTIPDWIDQQAELISGGVDWMYNVPTDIARAIAATRRASHLNGPSTRIAFVAMDAANVTGMTGNPFTKLAVRRAIFHAIDREAIVRNLVKGGAQVIHAACHPVQFGCTDDVVRYPFDPRKAKALLAEAGYPDGFGFDFWVYREKPVARAIIADLAKVGIMTKARYVNAARLATRRRAGAIAAYLGTWGSGGTADMAAIARSFWSLQSNRNLSGDKEVAAHMLGAERTPDPAKRKELYRKGLRLIAERAYWVPLYAFSLNYLTSNDLHFPVPKDGLPRLYRARWR